MPSGLVASVFTTQPTCHSLLKSSVYLMFDFERVEACATLGRAFVTVY